MLPICVRAHAVQIRGWNFRSKFAKLSRAWQELLLIRVLTTTTINRVVVLVCLTCTSRFFLSCLLMGDLLGNATININVINRLLVSPVSRTVYTKFHLHGERQFLELSYVKYIQGCLCQMSPKIDTIEVYWVDTIEVYWVSRRDRAGLSKLLGLACILLISIY